MQNSDYYNEDAIDFNSPDKILVAMEEFRPQDDDRAKLIYLLRDTVRFIQENSCDSDALVLGILYALEDPITITKSTRQRARENGWASGIISHYTTRYQREVLFKA